MNSESPSIVSTPVVRVQGTERIERTDWLAREEPLEIRVRGRSIAVTMRTPGHDSELACGFLFTEGLVRSPADIVELAECPRTDADARGNILNVFLRPGLEIDFDRLTRHTFASSSCGLCGKASIEAVHQHFPPVQSALRLPADLLRGLPEQLRVAQTAFAKTGGLHAAGLFDLHGGMLAAREDVGRHNAVDKVIGWSFLEDDLPQRNAILVVSGRASFEIMQKALAAGVAIIAAVSAPSSLAVDFARESGQTLIGFLRGAEFNVYSHPERVL